MLPATSERIARFSSKEINRRIHDQTAMNVARYGTADPDSLSHRLYQLDNEWDVDRVFQSYIALAALAGTVLAAAFSPWWLIVPGVAALLLLLHSTVGWCPPVSLLRRMGYRTLTEIDYERYALKALRGDFQRLPAVSEQKELLKIDELLEDIKH